MLIRQSSLASFSYCAQRWEYESRAKNDPSMPQGERLSATIAGSVFHYVLEVMQRMVHEGRDDALETALATFDYYWDPAHTAEICEGPPTVWMPRQTWGGVRSQSKLVLPEAYEWMSKGVGSKDVLLGTEVSFDIPFYLPGDDEEHTLHGTIDRLVLRMIDRRPVLGIDDWKTGKRPFHLQYATQWTAYSWASLHPAFWTQFMEVPGFDELEERLLAKRGFSLYPAPDDKPVVARRGRWLAVRDGAFKAHDAGWRDEQHYRRLMLMIQQYVAARRLGVHPLTTDTEKCRYCPFNQICGDDAPIPTYQIGVDEKYVD